MPLDDHLGRSEGGERLGAGSGDLRGQGGAIGDDANAAPATACDRLDHQRAAGGLALREHRHAARDGMRLGARLIAEQLKQRCIRPDEGNANRAAGGGKCGVFAQEAVTGVDRVAVCGARGGDDRLDRQISGRTVAVERNRLIRRRDMRRSGIVGGIDRDGRDAGQCGAARDADRDLSAIGDEQLADDAPPKSVVLRRR